MKTTSVADAKAHLSSLLAGVEAGETIHITRRGRAVAVVLSEEEYARLTDAVAEPGGRGTLFRPPRQENRSGVLDLVPPARFDLAALRHYVESSTSTAGMSVEEMRERDLL